jgi:LmbE family N-acetylglucosaminyl deacetylase
MYLSSLDQLTEHYDHIYLSPHLDDAMLSCGGAIIAQRQRGERVLVITFCTAAPDPAGPFSELALTFHQHWDLPPEEVVAARLHEDSIALDRVDADFYWAGLLDAIYRQPTAYHSRETLFNTPVDDPLLAQIEALLGVLRARQPRALISVPLGVGQHVDHQLTYRAALNSAGAPLIFYEDFPSVARPGVLEERLNALRERFSPQLVAIDTTIDAKIAAIKAYTSQLTELFGGVAQMEEAVRTHAAAVGQGAYAERLWKMGTR